MKTYLVGIAFAQLGVPFGLILFGLINGRYPESGDEFSQMLEAALVYSLIGAAISAVFSLLVAFPASMLLAKLSMLNFASIMVGALTIPVISRLVIGSFGAAPYLCAFIGGAIYWCYLRKEGALTSASRPTFGG